MMSSDEPFAEDMEKHVEALRRRLEQTEQSLRESQTLFRDFFEHGTMANLEIAPDGTVLRVNDTTLRIYGLPREQLEGRHVLDLICPDDRQRVGETFARAVRGEKTPALEFRVEGANGVRTIASAAGGVPVHRQGQFVALLVSGRDVTDRKQTEADLRESQERFRSVLEASHDLIYKLNLATGKYDYISPSCRELLGYDPDEVATLGFAELSQRFHPADWDRYAEHFQKLLDHSVEEQMEPVIEYRWRVRGGEYCWFSDSRVLLRDGQGRPTAIVGTVRDVTAQKLQDEIRRETEQRLQLIMQHTTDGVNMVEIDPVTHARRLVLCNDRFVEMSGRPREELMDMENINSLFAHHTMEHYERMEEGKAFQGRTSWLRPDGKENYFEWTGVAVKVEDRTYVVGIDRDVTERVLHERAMRRQQERLELILKHATDGINIVEIDEATHARRLVLCNDRYVEMSGRSREELMALEDINPLFSNHDPEYYRRMSEGQPFQGSTSRVRPDGQENYMEWTGVPVRTDGRLYVVGIDRDVTERVLSERAMRIQQQRLELILKHATDGIDICRIDRQTGHKRLVLCNDRFVEMSGRSREELFAAENMDTLIVSHLPEDTAETRRRVRELGQSMRGLASWVRPDARENYYEWAAVPITVEGEVFIIGVDRDVTEQLRAARALEAANRKLLTAREEERRMLAAELHDSVSQSLIALRLAIRGCLTRSQQGSPQETQDSLAETAERCNAIIAEVRSICHGLYPPALESLGLMPALRSLGRDFQNHMAVRVRCGKDLQGERFSPAVEIAFFRIAQEALSNAVRHSGGSRVDLSLSRRGDRLQLSVHDNGRGFDVAAVGSAGIGLNTMRQRAEAIGGKLEILSKPGGTRVSVTARAEARPDLCQEG